MADKNNNTDDLITININFKVKPSNYNLYEDAIDIFLNNMITEGEVVINEG